MDKFLSSRCHVKKKNWKSQFSFICINYVRLTVWMFFVSKVGPVIGNFPKQKPLCWFGFCCIVMKTEIINCYWVTSRRSLRKRYTRQLKISGKRFSKRVLTIIIFFCNSTCFATTCEPKGFFFTCIACSECWQECKGNVKFPFWKRTLSLWILITRKQVLFTLNNDRWQTWRRKVHLSVFLIRPPAWMFLAGENKQMKATSVIQDTKENIVQHVSGETVLERSTLNVAKKIQDFEVQWG